MEALVSQIQGMTALAASPQDKVVAFSPGIPGRAGAGCYGQP